MKYIIFVALLVYAEAVVVQGSLTTIVDDGLLTIQNLNNEMKDILNNLPEAITVPILKSQKEELRRTIVAYVMDLSQVAGESVAEGFMAHIIEQLVKTVDTAYNIYLDGFSDSHIFQSQFIDAARNFISIPYSKALQILPDASFDDQDTIKYLTKEAVRLTLFSVRGLYALLLAASTAASGGGQ